MNDNIRKLGYFFIIIFAVLILYLGYLNVLIGPLLATDPHNRRLAAAEEAIIRGTIYDRNGIVLAEDRVTGNSKKRVYPFGSATGHLLGFISQRYGRTGLESTFDHHLLALDEAGKWRSTFDRILGRQIYGHNINLTIDSGLQKRAQNLLGSRNGAVVALDPKTGAMLAVVSSPTFDPGSIENVVKTENIVQNEKNVELKITVFDMLKKQSEDSPLLNRAVRGYYPPGSIFKIITGAGALEANQQNSNLVNECKGSITVNGFVLKDLASHGRIGFNDAMAVSCNTFFASLGLELGGDGLKKTARSFGFELMEYDKSGRSVGNYPLAGTEIPFNLGTLPLNKIDPAEVASTAIGQGRVLVSPMHMALVAAGIANGGVIMKPVVLEKVSSREGSVYKRMSPEVLYTAVSPEIAGRVAAAMKDSVAKGTGSQASVSGLTVAGKTGSAQNPHGETHAWFVGFAPAEDPRIAVAVVVENAGSGGGVAAPLARQIFRDYLKM